MSPIAGPLELENGDNYHLLPKTRLLFPGTQTRTSVNVMFPAIFFQTPASMATGGDNLPTSYLDLSGMASQYLGAYLTCSCLVCSRNYLSASKEFPQYFRADISIITFGDGSY
jgi:hypothetical protein